MGDHPPHGRRTLDIAIAPPSDPDHGNREDVALRFTAQVVAPQLITYWDNDWVPPASRRCRTRRALGCKRQRSFNGPGILTAAASTLSTADLATTSRSSR